MSSVETIWDQIELPLIAILRGIRPEETSDIVGALLEEGFRAIEIPLNSPSPFISIQHAVRAATPYDNTLIGAGTVLHPDDVDRVKEVGGNLIVSPNIDPAVVERALGQNMACFPGVFSPTEAHRAIQLGATGLKFFPADQLGPKGIAAIKATLPADIRIAAVGGVQAADFASYLRAGVVGFGLGSNLYKPGDTSDQVREKTRQVVSAFRQAA